MGSSGTANDTPSGGTWRAVVSVGIAAFVIYAFFAADYASQKWGEYSVMHQSHHAYFNYLADAFLHGQLHLRVAPSTTHDLVNLNGQLYLYWPPFPAVVMMPFVAVFGIGFSDILITLVVAAINVSMTYLLMIRLRENHVIEVSDFHLWAVVVCFAFGTVHLALAPLGRVWFTAQLLGYCFVLAAFLAAVSLEGRRAFVVAGLAIAAAVMTRNHLIMLGLWPAWYLIRKYRECGLRWLSISAAAGLVSVASAVLLLGLYNFARFGSVTEMGLDLHQMAGAFAAEYARYGAFHPHYLPTNLHYQYGFYPFPLSAESLMGGSLFLLTPLFFGAIWACRRIDISGALLTVSILMTSIPIALLMGTGWVQFGPRYTLDFTVPLLMLTAVGIKNWPRWTVIAAVLVSLVHYVIGTLFLSAALA